jgi:diaminohydroxyphosphoribosylaminopyrimidine deaminase/5-amino-6-(5-phosphoribosylamino)uracil reductase
VARKGTIIICSKKAWDSQKSKRAVFERMGAKIMAINEENGHISIKEALKLLAADIGIQRLLVEGGGAIHSSFIAGGFADRAALFIAPRFFGKGIGLTNNLFVNSMEETENYSLRIINTQTLGNDLLVNGIFNNVPDL